MREAIGEAYKTALKAGDKRRTATLRADQCRHQGQGHRQSRRRQGPARRRGCARPAAEDGQAARGSLGIYEKAGREDLAVVEREEIAILTEFLPKSLSDAEVEDAIKAAIAKTGAAGAKDMGKVIASLKADYPGRIDFGKASGKVKAALG